MMEHGLFNGHKLFIYFDSSFIENHVISNFLIDKLSLAERFELRSRSISLLLIINFQAGPFLDV